MSPGVAAQAPFRMRIVQVDPLAERSRPARPGAPSAARILRSTVAVSSARQSIARSGWRIGGRSLPRTPGTAATSGSGFSPRAMRSSVSRSTATAASVTSLR